MTELKQWSAPMWQAHIERIEPFEERKRVLEEEVPPEWRDRVGRHLMTVMAIRKFHAKKRK